MLLMHLIYALTFVQKTKEDAWQTWQDDITNEDAMTEQMMIKTLLDQNKGEKTYDWRVRPMGEYQPKEDVSPVVVTVNLYLRTISKVDDVNMEYSLHFTFREEWVDHRLKFNSPTLKHIILAPSEDQKIWMPDTFFQNEKDGKKHDIDKPNVMLRVYNGTGSILYSVRMTLTLSCPMNLQDYPMDIQVCHVDFASYAYTTNDIEYRWKDVNPVQIKAGLKDSLPSFVLSDVTTANCTSKTNTGTYSCLRTILKLKREFSYYLLQLYIPSLMLVAVSWVSFWLDKDSVPARVTLGVTTLLTMTTQASGINAKLPPVSYTKAIDVWIGVCLAFIFGALLEFALVNWAARKDMLEDNKKRRLAMQRQSAPMMAALAECSTGGDETSFQKPRLLAGVDVAGPSVGLADGYRAPVCYSGLPVAQQQHVYFPATGADPEKTVLIMNPGAVNDMKTLQGKFKRRDNRWHKLWNVKYKQKSKRIDVLSRILFPISFLLFNLGYWIKYIGPYLAVEEHSGPRKP